MHHRLSRALLVLWLAGAALVACGPSRVTFEVTVPPETPAGATLAIEGRSEASPTSAGPRAELQHESNGLFKGSLEATPGMLSYRLSLTAPTAQFELSEAGALVPQRTLEVGRGPQTVRLTVERWGPESGLQGTLATFFVQAPANTPAGSEIWLSGNLAVLGEWNGAGVKLEPTLDGRYAATVPIAPNTPCEFKVTRGSWATVEKGPNGEELPNRTFRMGERSTRVDTLVVANWADILSRPPEQVLTGNVRYLRDVNSQILNRRRDIIVWLPPDYETNTSRRYPVLYMHDGQNLMDASTAFAGEWNVDETAQRLVGESRVEPLIIVGVYNAGSDRSREYTPVSDPNSPSFPGGEADAYGRFLVEELKPLIDSTYRTKPEPEHTGLAGSSLGGLVSMYLGMKHPDTFRRLGVISPSVFWANRDILTRVNALPAKLPLRIWVDIGTDELSSGETVEDAEALRDALVAKGWVLEQDLRYLKVEGGRHNEAAWSARFGSILEYLFPPGQ